MARDLFHNEVRSALEKDGWQITHDPYHLHYGVADIYIDLAAKEAIAAEKQGRKIAVEIKSFLGGSPISQFHTALGQFLNYQIVLELEDRDRTLYLAIPIETYEAFFRFEPVKTAIARFQVRLLVYNTEKEEIEQWIG